MKIRSYDIKNTYFEKQILANSAVLDIPSQKQNIISIERSATCTTFVRAQKPNQVSFCTEC